MTSFDLAPYKVLIVDDERFSRLIVTRLLQGLECTDIETAKDGAQALDILRASKSIDLVISDFDMPVINGLELLKAVRSGAAGVPRELQFAMLTSFSDKYLVDMALSLDVGAFLVKQVSKNTLHQRLEKMLGHEDNAPQIQAAHVYGTTFIKQADDAYGTAREKRDALDKTYKSMGQESPAERATRPAEPATPKRTVSSKQQNSSAKEKFSEADLARNLAKGIKALESGGERGKAPKVVTATGRPPARPAKKRASPVPAEKKPTPVPTKKKPAPVPAEGENEGIQFYPLADTPIWATLAMDIHTEDGSFLMAQGTSLTPQIITSLLHLEDMGLLALEFADGEDGIYAHMEPQGAATPPARPPSKTPAGSQDGNTMEIYQVLPGAVLSHDIYTVEGACYLEAGQVLTAGIIAILEDLNELGHLQSPVWIET